MPHENIYGHLGRVHWMRGHLVSGERCLEIGCGTGYRVTLPLRTWGYDVRGMDTDEPSIEYGRRLFEAAGQPPDSLFSQPLDCTTGLFDTIILSEVLEHLTDAETDGLLRLVRRKLRPRGHLLLTVPNGYGWFELESFLWKRLWIGAALTRSGVAPALRRLRALVVSGPTRDVIPSTLASTPHVQRYTLRSIQKRVAEAGFTVQDVRGSVLICGPFSELLFTGSKWAMSVNRWLGRRWPRAAAGFYVAAVGGDGER